MRTSGLSLLPGLLLLPCCSAVSLGFLREPVDECETAGPENLKKCYEAVMWALDIGIKEHPDWYPGVKLVAGAGHISREDNFKSVQTSLHSRSKAGCTRPCPRGYRRATTTMATTEAPPQVVQEVEEIQKRVTDMSEAEMREYIKGSMPDADLQSKEATRNVTDALVAEVKKVEDMSADDVEQWLQGNASDTPVQRIVLAKEAAENPSSNDTASSSYNNSDVAENASAPADEVQSSAVAGNETPAAEERVQSSAAAGNETPAAEEAQRSDAAENATAPAEGLAGPADGGKGIVSDEPLSVDSEPLPNVDNNEVEVTVAPMVEAAPSTSAEESNEEMETRVLDNVMREMTEQNESEQNETDMANIMENVTREGSEQNENNTSPTVADAAISLRLKDAVGMQDIPKVETKREREARIREKVIREKLIKDRVKEKVMREMRERKLAKVDVRDEQMPKQTKEEELKRMFKEQVRQEIEKQRVEAAIHRQAQATAAAMFSSTAPPSKIETLDEMQKRLKAEAMQEMEREKQEREIKEKEEQEREIKETLKRKLQAEAEVEATAALTAALPSSTTQPQKVETLDEIGARLKAEALQELKKEKEIKEAMKRKLADEPDSE